jgi:hypothetical protein
LSILSGYSDWIAMRVGIKSRCVASLLAVGYLLAISAAPLFHNHAAENGGGCCHERSAARVASAEEHHTAADCHRPHHKTPGAPSRCPADDGRCSVCQFLGQAPAPTAEVVLISSGTLVQEVSSPPPPRLAIGVFSAWHSRGPPAFA